MDNIFLLKILISFIVGSIWVTSLTIIAEKFGPKIGGVIGGMPSTALIALLFIGWTQSPAAAVQAAAIIPLSSGLHGFFILTYSYLIKYNFILSILIPFFIWILLTLGLASLKFDNFEASLFLGLLSLIISYLVIEFVLKIKSQTGNKYKFSVKNIFFRALLSGTIIALSVAAAKLGGPLVGGVMASFPAVYISTMIITYRSQGAVFSAGVMKILMISGIISVTIYASAVRFFYPLLGLVNGTVVSFLISIISIYAIYRFVKKIP